MAITISGSGITSANIADGTIVNADVNDVSASKLTGALPAISGASLTNIPDGSAIAQVKATTAGTRVATTHTSWVEPSTSYRVSITPQYANSMIKLEYFLPFNQDSSANILTPLRAFRTIDGGAKSYALTSAGNSNGARHVIAGGCIRPVGYDLNDQQIETLHVIDYPNSTGVCTYGFESYPEGSNATYWGYSGGNSGTWGYDADIVIIATEVRV